MWLVVQTQRSLPHQGGKQTAQMLSFEHGLCHWTIGPRDELRRFRHVRGRECGRRVLEWASRFSSLSYVENDLPRVQLVNSEYLQK